MTDKATSDLWWKDGVIYCADVATWVDSDGDGVGDLAGLTRRLDYLSGLGITTLWMMPFYPSPLGDDGYDITDYYAVDPRFGTLGDFVEMIRTAGNLGIRVLVDLVLNHTSNQHPWFQQARRDRNSRYRDYYRWSDQKQDEPSEVAFPGEQKSTWTFDDVAGQWYMHRYFDFMPELNITKPDVRDEMNKILGFWLELGISGFRVDSLQFMIETVGTSARDKPISYLRSLVEFVERRRGDAVFLGEANVSPPEQRQYFELDGGDGVQMLFDFRTCAAQWLAHARGSAEPLVQALNSRPRIPVHSRSQEKGARKSRSRHMTGGPDSKRSGWAFRSRPDVTRAHGASRNGGCRSVARVNARRSPGCASGRRPARSRTFPSGCRPGNKMANQPRSLLRPQQCRGRTAPRSAGWPGTTSREAVASRAAWAHSLSLAWFAGSGRSRAAKERTRPARLTSRRRRRSAG